MTPDRDDMVTFKCPNCGSKVHFMQGLEDRHVNVKCPRPGCGRLELRWLVPARAKIIKPSNADLIELRDDVARLDTGMTAGEATIRACQWWEVKGRRTMLLEKMRQREVVGGSNKGAGGEFASLDPDSPNFMPSGVIHGQPWDTLTKDEKIRIVKTWHHFHVRNPDLLGADPDAPYRMGDDVVN
jgi:hypothetical protein